MHEGLQNKKGVVATFVIISRTKVYNFGTGELIAGADIIENLLLTNAHFHLRVQKLKNGLVNVPDFLYIFFLLTVEYIAKCSFFSIPD